MGRKRLWVRRGGADHKAVRQEGNRQKALIGERQYSRASVGVFSISSSNRPTRSSFACEPRASRRLTSSLKSFCIVFRLARACRYSSGRVMASSWLPRKLGLLISRPRRLISSGEKRAGCFSVIVLARYSWSIRPWIANRSSMRLAPVLVPPVAATTEQRRNGCQHFVATER